MNVAIGVDAGLNITTGSDNTAVGGNTLINNLTGSNNTVVGRYAGEYATGASNTFIGRSAGFAITSGEKNTILGRYNGNAYGLDIRTSSNNIVLSDGDGNPRVHIDDTGDFTMLGPGQIRAKGDNGLAVYASNSITVADGATITLSGGASSQLICIGCASSGAGGTFFANYNTVVSQIAGSTGAVTTSDSGAYDIAVYKAINNNTVTFKNRSGATKVYNISMFCASNGELS